MSNLYSLKDEAKNEVYDFIDERIRPLPKNIDGSYDEFALDILSVDFKNPLFSKTRCELLGFLTESDDWKQLFLEKLKNSNTKVAIELVDSLSINNKEDHILEGLKFLTNKQKSWIKQKEVNLELNRLNLLRLSVYKDEISMNPLGQILEPGFRIIFPVFKAPLSH